MKNIMSIIITMLLCVLMVGCSDKDDSSKDG